MPISYSHARGFIGKQVIAQCIGGKQYYGMVREVTRETVILDLVGPGAGYVSANGKKLNISKADKPSKTNRQQVRWGYPGYGYGYGGLGYGGYAGYASLALPLYVILALSLPFVW
ncbi:hypothetical protein [Ammoniphilus sp. CFH 90114]|uniref:hypothetical protein n=1 Tax=Ammoniphilus sp. CFH 90114 TaxID=2493665 RepID=UPI00100FED66|nr:hypothetical protein [Ammoniphilus sp. CFH 90114]RXT06278.1 hypothetical protein EIZ39_14420 [Ammoniphilus sp. CFH 90114]